MHLFILLTYKVYVLNNARVHGRESSVTYVGEFCRNCEVAEVSESEVEGDKLEMVHSTISSSTAQSS